MPSAEALPAFYFWLSASPRVLLFSENGNGPALLCRHLDPAPVTGFLQYSWWKPLDGMYHDYQLWRHMRPQDQVVLLVNSADEMTALRARQVRCSFVSTSSFIDFNLPRVLDVPKQYDAIYVARLSAIKRHVLAAKVKSLLVVGDSLAPWDTPEEAARIHQALPAATFLGSVWAGRVPWLNAAAYAGLILSEEEGASRVAAEYQLCGLPVVTTLSRGGRDQYLAKDFTSYVAAAPHAVRDAVKYWRRNPPDPYTVRQAVLTELLKHRRRFLDRVTLVLDDAEAYAAFRRRAALNKLFCRQFWSSRIIQHVERFLAVDTACSV